MTDENLNKDQRIVVRVSKREKVYLQSKADYCGLSLSEFLRKIAITGVVIKRDTSQTVKILNELQRIGNNINQIAKVIHEQGDYIYEENYIDVQDQFSEMKDIIIDRIFKASYEYEARLNEIMDQNVRMVDLFDEDEDLFDAAALEEEEWENYDEGAFV